MFSRTSQSARLREAGSAAIKRLRELRGTGQIVEDETEPYMKPQTTFWLVAAACSCLLIPQVEASDGAQAQEAASKSKARFSLKLDFLKSKRSAEPDVVATRDREESSEAPAAAEPKRARLDLSKLFAPKPRSRAVADEKTVAEAKTQLERPQFRLKLFENLGKRSTPAEPKTESTPKLAQESTKPVFSLETALKIAPKPTKTPNRELVAEIGEKSEKAAPKLRFNALLSGLTADPVESAPKPRKSLFSAALAQPEKPTPSTSRVQSRHHPTLGHSRSQIRTTAYTHTEDDHKAWGRKTALGTLLRCTQDYNSAAADWSRFPVGTVFKIKGESTTYVVDDYGSALVGSDTIDIYRPSIGSMNNWGVRHVDIEIIKNGCFKRSKEILEDRQHVVHCAEMYRNISA